MLSEILILLPLFLAVAILYSSVGHGGATSYLAILVLAGFSREGIAPTVLVLNILVTLLGSINYYRAGHFDGQLLLPFILASVPAAFIGGSLRLAEGIHSTITGLTLFAAGFRFLLFASPISPRPVIARRLLYSVGLPVGFALGFLAGLIGIGGGVFLSPLLLLMGWADAKKTAALSAAFILLNSSSGLIAHILKGPPDWALLASLGVTVCIGGWIGSHVGAFRLLPTTLLRILGVVLLMAASKLLI